MIKAQQLERESHMNTTHEQINQHVAEIFGYELDEIEAELDLHGDLNASDMEITDMVATLEDSFDIEIAESEIQSLITVGDIYELVMDKLNEIS